ncbi:unnamed protein product [Pieris macdunnoughi]|uniref:Gustatory receptor n=1 Tax=Pieris macdunnoughi TaxID=345717 RepID=A0A821QSL6_9NEOP|nr:unnamed protein product [Pieris macdunnoughi]
MEPTCIVSGIVLTVFRISRVFGLAPLSITQIQEGHRITLSKVAIYYGYLLLGLLLPKFFVNILVELHRIMFLVMEIQMTIIGFEIHKRLEYIENQLGELNKNIREGHIVHSEDAFDNVELSFRPLSKYFLITCECIEKIEKSEGFFALISISLCSIQVIFTADQLASNVGNEHDKKTKPQMSDILISLRALSKAFVTICNICYKYNDSDSLLALALSSTCTINLIRTIYNFSQACTSSDVDHKTFQIYLEFCYMVLHLFRIILYVDSSSEISKEVDEIRYQIAQLSQLVTSVGKIMPLEAEIFQSGVLINNPVLMPMGLFTVSRGLIGPAGDKEMPDLKRLRYGPTIHPLYTVVSFVHHDSFGERSEGSSPFRRLREEGR